MPSAPHGCRHHYSQQNGKRHKSPEFSACNFHFTLIHVIETPLCGTYRHKSKRKPADASIDRLPDMSVCSLS